jgi:hypothetical protein
MKEEKQPAEQKKRQPILMLAGVQRNFLDVLSTDAALGL